MVDEAKGGKVSAEKRLADAAGKVHVQCMHKYMPLYSLDYV